ncbi:bifunctional metallophosphatase/5'-nucleotidase [Paenibacillus allorhizosphaerae]|uniref:Endonuclease YhcR n=1 Tax=Paenibacillus allorhizosphaerae TaxID=2849866 RepID=A0ABM8VAS4_9BACL|nr:bifunctional UDP-sugar hydrolase/5'-nucleotidase [Paenibacillus allorhizosphaerae]CAG7617322.1 Endonuclease YhcR [Paenibacillus allorhizosphaerae]
MYETREPLSDQATRSETEPIELQLLAITDFHGYLQPASDKANGEIQSLDGPLVVGGAAYLAAHLKRLRAGHANSLLLSNGDNFSGWPIETAAFKSEPTIEFLNAIGVEVSSAGNHEFDVSPEFLIRHMMNGECFGTEDIDGCYKDSTGKPFRGCHFDYISANVRDARNGQLVLKPYIIKHIPDGRGGTVPVGIIGLIEEAAFTKEQMSVQSGVLYADSLLESANRYAEELRDQGVQTIIALVHEGGSADSSGLDFNGCERPWGPAIDFAAKASPAIDVIITGHWHAAFNCLIDDPDGNPRPVVEGSNHGRLITEINLYIDPLTKDVLRDKTRCINHPNTRDIAPDPDIEAMVAYWSKRAQEQQNVPLAKLKGDLLCARNAYGESAFANVVADAFYAAAQKIPQPVDFAMTVGLPKGDLLFAKGTVPTDLDGTITFGELLHSVGAHTSEIVVTLSGKQIQQILEEQWSQGTDGTVMFQPVNVSYNVQYAYDLHQPLRARIAPADVIINGEKLDPDRRYRVATNGLVAVNGGGYPSFSGYSDALRIASWPVMDYIKAQGEIQAPKLNRIRAKHA